VTQDALPVVHHPLIVAMNVSPENVTTFLISLAAIMLTALGLDFVMARVRVGCVIGHVMSLVIAVVVGG